MDMKALGHCSCDPHVVTRVPCLMSFYEAALVTPSSDEEAEVHGVSLASRRSLGRSLSSHFLLHPRRPGLQAHPLEDTYVQGKHLSGAEVYSTLSG